LKENASTLYEKNYHGQFAEGMGHAYSSAATKASHLKHNYYKKDQYGNTYIDPSSELQDKYNTPYGATNEGTTTGGGYGDEDDDSYGK